MVGKTKVGKAEVSTVFLGLNHNWLRGEPLLWETMIFGGPHSDEYQERCSGTWVDAEAMHNRAVAMLQSEQKGGN